MPDDKILHFADHHDETAVAISLPSHIRAYRDYLEHFHRLEQDADLPELPDEFPDAKAVARVNQGRWLWLCAACNAGILLDEDDKHSICVRCGSNGWMEVGWPENKAKIETELLKMTGTGLGKRLVATVREWRPGWTLAYLEERTKKALELSKKGGRVRALSIGARRIFTVGEILTADHMNTYVSDIEDDLAGANGIIELETDAANNVGGLRVPRLTTVQRNAQTTTNGVVLYDTTLDRFVQYRDGDWFREDDIQPLHVTTTERNALTVANGTIVCDTTLNRIVRRENGAWVVSDDLTHQVLSGFTRGDILYVNSSGELARLAASTSGRLLETRGASANPRWTNPPQVPTGLILDFGGTTAPTGYLGCDGAAVSRTTYDDLFGVISTTWGTGNGTTTFNVPNLQRRATIGSGGTRSEGPQTTVGSTGGAETHTLTEAEMYAHSHLVAISTNSGSALTSPTHNNPSPHIASQGTITSQNNETDYRLAGSSGTPDEGQTTSTGSSNAHSNMQPSATVLKIIKT